MKIKFLPLVILSLVLSSCLPISRSRLKGSAESSFVVGDNYPSVSEEEANKFFEDWDNKWQTEEIVNIKPIYKEFSKSYRRFW